MPGIALRRWRWLESGLIPLASATMRVAWLTPLLYFLLNNNFVAPRGMHVPAWLILGVLLAASVVESALQEHPNGPTIAAGAGLLAILIVLAVVFRLDLAHPFLWLRRVFANLTDFRTAFPATLIVILATALIWRRGMTASWHSYRELFKGFTTGVLILGFLLLVPRPAAWEASGLNRWGSVLAFVVSALFSLSMIAAYESMANEMARGGAGGTAPVLSRPWLGTALGVVFAVIALGWIGAQIFSPEAIKETLELFSPIWLAIRTAILYVWMGLAYIVFWALGPLLDILRAAVSRNWEQTAERVQERLEDQLEQVPQAAAEPSLLLQQILRIAFIVMMVAVVALILYYGFRRRQRSRHAGIEEERELVWSKELLLQQIRDIFGRRRAPEHSPFLALTGEDPRQAIRRLYQRLLSRAGELGRARSPSLTPRAYARSLSDLLPSEDKALTTLTEAYLLARYSPDTPTSQHVADANQAWDRIQAHLGGPTGS